MSAPDDAQAPVVDGDALARHALRLALLKARQASAATNLAAARKVAEPLFAAARNAFPQVEPRLPDGTKLGLIAIKKGAEVWTVDEDALIAVAVQNDAGDFEDYADPAVVNRPDVLALLREHLPDLVQTRLSRDARARYDKELRDHGGTVLNTLSGEREKVATVDHLSPTGEFAFTPVKDYARLLDAAIEAGQITEWGDPVAPVEPQIPAPAETRTAVDPGGETPVDRARRVLAATSPAPSGARKPTGEQQAILDAFADRRDLAVTARAGTGKTTVLKMLAGIGDERGLTGRYLAFNADVVKDAQQSGAFPASVKVSTAHSLALGAMRRRIGDRLGRKGYVPGPEQARILGIRGPVRLATSVLRPVQVAWIAQQIVAQFCQTADAEIGPQHVTGLPGITTPESIAVLQAEVLPYARRAWENLTATGPDAEKLPGLLKFDHGHYLKLWQLSAPRIRVGYVLYDEAQDASPVVLDVVLRQQREYGTQVIAVGDEAQAINEFTGAVNALARFPGTRLALSQSWRFGDAIAGEANKWLTVLRSDPPVIGAPHIQSRIGEVADPDAILCRTNAGVIGQVFGLLASGRKVALAGKADEIRGLAQAAADLKNGLPTTHPEFIAFGTWGAVQDHVENDPSAGSLRVLVKLIDDHGPEAIIKAVDALVPEAEADVTVSTAHKSKGREWDRVQVGQDFPVPDPDEDVDEAEARLAYVTVTRARQLLDPGSLAWITGRLAGGAR